MHVLPLQRVDAVRDPYPVRPLEHAEVDAGTPDEQDSISRPGWAALSSSSSR
jgi:hypothetical protein